MYESFPDYMKLASAIHFFDPESSGITVPELHKILEGELSKKGINIALDILALHAEAEPRLKDASEPIYKLTEEGKTTLNTLINNMSGMPILPKRFINKFYLA